MASRSLTYADDHVSSSPTSQVGDTSIEELQRRVSSDGTGVSGEKKKAKKLTVLKDCVIYVDVKTEDGSEAGELFANMLKGLGARVR